MLDNVLFHEATAAEFEQFWKGRGWRVWPKSLERNTVNGYEILVFGPSSEFWPDPGQIVVCPRVDCTLGEALDQLNQVAEAFGGWEEGGDG